MSDIGTLLYLVRHGRPKPEAEDPARPLSEEGRRELQRLAGLLAPLGLTAAEICHSPKLRAAQTAEILATAFMLARGRREAGGLRPMDDPAEWYDRLRGVRENLVLVGHLPHLGRLASLLLKGDAGAPVLTLPAGAVGCLGRDGAGFWSVHWLITPESTAAHGGG